MSRIHKAIITAILIFSLYHLFRDISQIIGFHSVYTNVFHRHHSWCRPICDHITLPLDLFGIIGSMLVLSRNRLGVLGLLLFLSAPIWLLALILP